MGCAAGSTDLGTGLWHGEKTLTWVQVCGTRKSPNRRVLYWETHGALLIDWVLAAERHPLNLIRFVPAEGLRHGI